MAVVRRSSDRRKLKGELASRDCNSGPGGLVDGVEGRQGGRVARHVVRHVGDLEVNEFSAVLFCLLAAEGEEGEEEEKEVVQHNKDQLRSRRML